jgi:hypothetical protein
MPVSEFPRPGTDRVALLTQHYLLLQRNLACTAMTQGKQPVILTGNKKDPAVPLKDADTRERYSSLQARLPTGHSGDQTSDLTGIGVSSAQG